LESPELGLWGDDGVGWEWWVVCVGVGGGLLAGLDGELGSILQESLGSTTAECLSADWSGTDGSVGVWGWEGAEGACGTNLLSVLVLQWREGGLGTVVVLDLLDQSSSGGGVIVSLLHGFLSGGVGCALAASDFGGEGGFGGLDAGLDLGDGTETGVSGGDIIVVGTLELGLNLREVAGGLDGGGLSKGGSGEGVLETSLEGGISVLGDLGGVLGDEGGW